MSPLVRSQKRCVCSANWFNNGVTTANSELDHFDISEQLSKELQVGNLHLSLSDIGWPSDIQDGLNGLNTVLSTLFILYIVGISATGLNIVTPPIVLLRERSRLGQFSKGLASLSFLSLLAASIIITFVQFKAVDLINKYGNDIGVYASGGGEFMAFTWVAVLFMFIVVVADTCGERMATWDIPRVWSAGPSQIDFKTAKLRYWSGTVFLGRSTGIQWDPKECQEYDGHWFMDFDW